MAIKTKEQRINAEKRRLNRIFATIEETKKDIVVGLIERAAFMRIQLEDLENDLNEHGWTERFKQAERCAEFERARPAGQSYISLNGNYQKIIKQLIDIMPEDANKDAAEELMKFINMRK